ncbi:FtsK/SpoIIIE family protein [Actinokineospora auranticolor]|uniref:FtsK/SpoIIIE family protein n=1 Tax=Actinokineospora auranticolor TaxID=155976 RepID=A0A2S6GLN1_9PSEU|nr:FtsK/SpoIIIE family protein [Actinokineospora auranticolor]
MHSLLIGATGSGKSEPLRTLVLGLAMTRSSELLNFVLVDFKGGATFLGLDRLPLALRGHHQPPRWGTPGHPRAGLPARRDGASSGFVACAGKLFVSCGLGARPSGGAALNPPPTPFLIVDESSELLAANPDFAELFVMIGRLGRAPGAARPLPRGRAGTHDELMALGGTCAQLQETRAAAYRRARPRRPPVGPRRAEPSARRSPQCRGGLRWPSPAPARAAGVDRTEQAGPLGQGQEAADGVADVAELRDQRRWGSGGRGPGFDRGGGGVRHDPSRT